MKEQDLKFLLAAALEGGSNYWYTNAKPRSRVGDDFYDDIFDTALRLEVDNASEYDITKKDLQDGLLKVKEKFPMVYSRIINEQYDAADADVWLQLVVFNEVIYG